MNEKTKQALEMAIEALENACIKIEKWTKGGKWTAGKEALAKCKEALEQPQPKLFLDLSNSNGNHPVQQEPVAVVETIGGYPDESVHTVKWLVKYKDLKDGDKLYTHPAPQPAQEPVAKQYLVVDENDCHGDGSVYRGLRGKDSSIPTYRIETHPAPAWQGLNDDEIVNIVFERDGLLERILEINDGIGAI